MNYFNISSVDSKVRTRAGFKSKSRETKIAKPGILKVLLSYTMALLGAKCSFDLLGIAKLCKVFF